MLESHIEAVVLQRLQQMHRETPLPSDHRGAFARFENSLRRMWSFAGKALDDYEL